MDDDQFASTVLRPIETLATAGIAEFAEIAAHDRVPEPPARTRRMQRGAERC